MEMEAYAETSECRKEFILHYFGEEHTCERKGMCDNCRFPREQKEAKQDVVLVMKAVATTNEQSTIPQVLNILAGRKVQDIASSGHDRLEVFGAGKDKDLLWWGSVIRKALLHNLLRKDIEQFGILKITPEGKKFMAAPYSMLVSLNHNFSNTDSSDDDEINGSASRSNALDNTLLEMLRDLRKNVAKKKNVPPYVVFQDPSLEDMATQYPITIEELSNISGVNAGKAQRYGEEFLKLINAYVEENDIDRPSDFVMKSVANKSAQKVSIIQSIDRKIPLEDIARGQGLNMNDLLQEIESIVFSGTRLNLSYYINNKIDEDTQEIIYDYFMESDSDSLDAAYKELKEEDVEQNEIRLVRVKFISEMAN
jgi:ATP-dependent DNA helicase RecQ